VSDLKGLGRSSAWCPYLDILGRPVTDPAGATPILIDEIRATAAGTAAGTSVDLANWASTCERGAIGDDISVISSCASSTMRR